MTQVGKIVRRKNGELAGYIHMLKVSLEFGLKKQEKRTEKTPDYQILANNEQGVVVSIGGAWDIATKHGSYAGSSFLSLTFDDESFDRVLNVVAYPDPKNPEEWDIVWQRKRTDEQSRKLPTPSFPNVATIS